MFNPVTLFHRIYITGLPAVIVAGTAASDLGHYQGKH